MLSFTLILSTLLISEASARAFGHAVEYRFEYDPSKNARPVEQWRYNDLMPNKYPAERSFGSSKEGLVPFSSSSRSGNALHFQRHRAYSANSRSYGLPIWAPDSDFQHKDLADAMSNFLREQSEAILQQQLPHNRFEVVSPFHFINKEDFPNWFR